VQRFGLKISQESEGHGCEDVKKEDDEVVITDKENNERSGCRK